MTIEQELPKAQVAILHVLLFQADARFADLQKSSGLSSDHFNFYLKQMIDQGLVAKKADGAYQLTLKGKEFANRFDTEARTVERQPKVCVCLMIRRDDGMQLLQQRLKQPFYGYWGRPTGKIRWGETILEAAARELMEETGLTADLTYESVYHKQDYNRETGDMLEDKIFFIIGAAKPRGELIVDFEGGRNAWMTQEEYANQELNFESTKEAFETDNIPTIQMIESKHDYKPEHY